MLASSVKTCKDEFNSLLYDHDKKKKSDFELLRKKRSSFMAGTRSETMKLKASLSMRDVDRGVN